MRDAHEPDAARALDAATSDASDDAAFLDAYVPDAALDASTPRDSGIIDPPHGPMACGAPAAVAFRIDPARRAAQPDDALRLPLVERWRRDGLGGRVSYALSACGRVFVVVASSPPFTAPSAVLALDPATGATLWGPIDTDTVPDAGANAVYEDEHVFVVRNDGVVSSFAAATGDLEWRTRLGGVGDVFSSTPIASGGRLLLTGGILPTIYALDEGTGAVQWAVPTYGNPGLATDESRLYTGECSPSAYDVVTGARVWTAGSCGSSPPQVPAVHAGNVYVRENRSAFRLATEDGTLLDTLLGGSPPAFANRVAYLGISDRVRALPDGSATPTWVFNPPEAIVWAPLVVGDHVVVGTNFNLFVLSRADGSIADVHALATPYYLGTEAGGSPDLDLSEAGGVLFVPIDGGLVAF